jgi:hypothetical protein
MFSSFITVGHESYWHAGDILVRLLQQDLLIISM